MCGRWGDGARGGFLFAPKSKSARNLGQFVFRSWKPSLWLPIMRSIHFPACENIAVVIRPLFGRWDNERRAWRGWILMEMRLGVCKRFDLFRIDCCVRGGIVRFCWVWGFGLYRMDMSDNFLNNCDSLMLCYSLNNLSILHFLIVTKSYVDISQYW